MARAYAADSLRESVEDFIKEQFAPFDIRSVEVYEDADQGRFPVLDIIVFFSGTTSELALQEPSGFITRLQAHLVGMGEHSFPLVSFRLASLRAA